MCGAVEQAHSQTTKSSEITMTDQEHRQPVIGHGDKVLIITRRMFSTDPRRHFAGTVERYDGVALRVSGYVFTFNTETSAFERRKSMRTRIFPLDNHIILNVLPSDADVGAIRYVHGDNSELIASDGKNFRLELSEFNGG